jgi:fibronectin type 3 domain-containing protein
MFLYYRVSAVDPRGIESKPGASVRGIIKGIRAPANVRASDGMYETHVAVTWDSVTGARSYKVYRSADSADSGFALLATVTSLSHGDSTASTSVSYYVVRAVDGNGRESPLSAADQGRCKALAAPENVAASDGVSLFHIRITWNAVSGASRYAVYRSRFSSSRYTLTTTVDTTVAIDSVDSTGAYYYKIAAIDRNDNEGPVSNWNEGRLGTLIAPLGFKASNNMPAGVRLTWSRVADATAYCIYRGTSSAGPFTAIDTTADTLYFDSLTASISAYYKVSAMHPAVGIGPMSAYGYGSKVQPPSVSIAAQPTYIRLSWYSVPTTILYRIYRSGDNVNFQKLDSTAALWYNDTVTDTSLYYYKVSACNEYGETAPSAVRSARIAAGPTNLVAQLSGTDVQLTWNAIPGASFYSVYRSNDPDAGYVMCGTAYSPSLIDRPTVSGTYYYKVQAGISGSTTGYSNIVSVSYTAPPQPPANVSAAGEYGCIRITWSPGSPGNTPEGYIVFRSTSSYGTYTAIDTTDTTVYRDSSVNQDISYYYRVSSYAGTAVSVQSSYVYASPLRTQAPSGLTTSMDLYGSHIALSWNASSGATEYHIYRSTSSSTAFSCIDTVSTAAYNDSTAGAGVYYYYKVGSYGPTGASYLSSYSSGRRLAPPGSVSASGYAGYIRVYWSSVTSALRYIIYRALAAEGTFERIDSTTTTAYNDSAGTADTYYYRVSSVNLSESGLSPASYGAKRSSPLAPSMVSATRGTLADSVCVVWRPSAGADSYLLYRSTDASFATAIVLRVTTADTTFNDYAASDSIYYYKAKAQNVAGQSVLSTGSVMGYRTPVAAPGPPGGLTASTAIQSYIQLAWTAPVAPVPVSGYRIYRADNLAGTYARIDSTTGVSYRDTAEKTFPDSYWYYITAYNQTGESVPSDTTNGMRAGN